ncbi:MAG: IS4 family transposase [Gammaproteobacteria bacterium]
MFSISELKAILKPYFKIDNRRLDCLTQILVALITVRTVNLVELAQAMITGGAFEARYKRIRRFLKEFNAFSFETLSKFIAQYFLPNNSKWQLSMDRTNWQWGKVDINILMISVVCGSVAIPLIWKFLPKKGNSNLEERVTVVEKFIHIFGNSIIADLVADREFVSGEWFKWLLEKQIPFTIRIKKNALVDSSKGNNLHVRRLFINLRPGQTRYLCNRKDIFGVNLWLAATRAEDGEWVIVASTHEPEHALMRYKKRWNIETLFGFLKSKGFNFEDTHVTLPERLHNLLSVLTIAFCFAYKVGQIIAKEQPIKTKKHGRLEKSVLRLGLDFLREQFFNIERSVGGFIGKIASIFSKYSFIDLVFSRS